MAKILEFSTRESWIYTGKTFYVFVGSGVNERPACTFWPYYACLRFNGRRYYPR